MFAQSEAVLRLILLTVTTHNVDGSMTALGPAARKRGLHGPRPPQGTPTHVSGTLTIFAVAFGSCQARAAVSSTAPSRRRAPSRLRAPSRHRAPSRRRGDGVLVRIFWGWQQRSPNRCVQMLLRCVKHYGMRNNVHTVQNAISRARIAAQQSKIAAAQKIAASGCKTLAVLLVSFERQAGSPNAPRAAARMAP